MKCFQVLCINETKNIRLIRQSYCSLIREYSKENSKDYNILIESYKDALLFSNTDIRTDINSNLIRNNIDDSELSALYDRALFNVYYGEPELAYHDLKTIYNINKNYKNTLELLIKVSLILNSPDKAVDYIGKIYNQNVSKKVQIYAYSMYIEFYKNNTLNTVDEIKYLATAYSYIGRVEDSNKLIEDSFDCNNLNEDILEIYINNFILLNNIRKAYDLSKEGINIYSHSYLFYYLKGKILTMLGKYDESVDCFNKALKVKNDLADIYINKSHSLNRIGEYEDALSMLKIARSYNKKLESIYINKVDSLIGLGRYKDCIVTCNKGMTLNNEFIEMYISKMQVNILLNSYDEAINIYEEATSIGINNSDLDYEKARALLMIDNLDEAKEFCLIAIEKNKEDIKYFNLLGKIYFLQTNYKEANNAFEKVLGLDIFKRDAYIYKFKSLEILGKIEDAISLMDDAINLKLSNLEEFYYNKAVLLYDIGNVKGAIINFINSLECNTEYIESNIALGIILSRESMYEESIKYLEKVINLDEDNLEALIELSNVYLKLNKYNKCINCSLQIIKYNINDNLINSSMYLNIALSLVEFGRLEEAEEYCEKGRILHTNNLNIIHLEILVCKYRKKYKKALDLYNSFIELGGEEEEDILTDIKRNLRLSKNK